MTNVGFYTSEKKTCWVAYTNTDTTEGRGADVPIAVCEKEATAIRMAKFRYVQGTDGPVKKIELIKLNGKWYAPSDAIRVLPPSREDIEAQAAIDARNLVLEKAKAAGLTDEDISALSNPAFK